MTRSRRPGRAYWPEAFKSHFTIRSLDARRVEEWARPRSAASIDVPAVVRLGCSLPRRSGRVPKSHGSVQRSMESCKSEDNARRRFHRRHLACLASERASLPQSLPTYLVPNWECRTAKQKALHTHAHNSSTAQGEIHTLRQNIGRSPSVPARLISFETSER